MSPFRFSCQPVCEQNESQRNKQFSRVCWSKNGTLQSESHRSLDKDQDQIMLQLKCSNNYLSLSLECEQVFHVETKRNFMTRSDFKKIVKMY